MRFQAAYGRFFAFGMLAVMCLLLSPCSAEANESAASIPEGDISALRTGLSAVRNSDESHISKRRALKNMVRKAQGMLEAAPDAANRFDLLGVVFQAEKQLLSLENSDRNRAALFKTCAALVEAPDAYSDIRLEADVLFSEKRLSEGGATLAERVESLIKLLERYRGTPTEARSLMMAALIAQKLGSRELERSIRDTMNEKFSDDLEIIEFRRAHLNAGRLDAVFKGEFERSDGVQLVFPSDAMGHMCFMVFWSKDEQTAEPLMAKIREYEEQYPGRFNVFSFNIDELPDAGASILEERGLDWTVMKLPGGREHPAYRAYARGDAVAVFVNSYGWTTLKKAPHFDAIGWRDVQTDVYGISGERISNERYLSQLQSLFVGDWLVWGERFEHPTSKLESIQECFVDAPFRYRLTGEQALENYRKAEKLCVEILNKEGDSTGQWLERNFRIIALLGMWNLDCEPKYLEEAVKESKAALASELPDGKDVVPRFCLAKAEIRENRDEADSVVRGFFKDCGGTNGAPSAATAAAAMLALDVGSRELHEDYRGLFLESHADNPDFYAFASFLRDKQHRFRLLAPNHTKRERWVRSSVVDFGRGARTNRLPDIELKQLNGEPFSLPDEDSDQMTILMFIEPPEDPDENIPLILNRFGNIDNGSGFRGMMHYSKLLADKHINHEIDIVNAFLCDDAEQVKWLMSTNDWPGKAVMVPGGLKNPMVNRLGILSADKMPNVFLLRRDGTVAWWSTGLPYREFGSPWVHHLGMKVAIEMIDVEYGCELLEQGEFKDAARIFSGPYLPWQPDRYHWRPVRYHGRALALMAAEEWEAADKAIDKALAAHKLRHFRGSRSKSIEDWQKDGETVVMEEPCNVISELWAMKAVILDKLGRGEDAKTFRKRAREVITYEHEDIYTEFHDRLKTWRGKR